MKFNWKAFVAIVVLIGTFYWGIDSLHTRSYSGTDLSFDVGSGPVTVTNLSEAPIAARLVGSEAGTFAVASNIEGIAGRSTTQGSGRNITQLFEFTLPPGLSEFAVTRSGGVSFIARSATSIEATVQPLDAESSQNTLMIAAVVILGALFYISRATGLRWIGSARKQASDRVATQETERQTLKRIVGGLPSDEPSH